jgi:hypothetical protein
VAYFLYGRNPIVCTEGAKCPLLIRLFYSILSSSSPNGRGRKAADMMSAFGQVTNLAWATAMGALWPELAEGGPAAFR